MSHLIKPENYHALLDLQQTEIAIKKIKDFFLSSISSELRLRRVTAPLFVLKGLGMNDDLNGVERPVTFPIKDMNEAQAEVGHSLAKWKRVTLAEYNVEPGYGIITDMNAIRADEEMDNLHSLYVDQWDWERVMPSHCRNTEYLKKIVNRIYNAILRTEIFICETYPQLKASVIPTSPRKNVRMPSAGNTVPYSLSASAGSWATEKSMTYVLRITTITPLLTNVPAWPD